MQLTEQQIEFLSKATAAEYGQWFLQGFKDWHDADLHYQAFTLLNKNLSSYQEIIDQLQTVYGLLPETIQKSWRLGLAAAIQDCPWHYEYMLALRKIFFLTDRLKAYEVFDAIKKWVNIFYGSTFESLPAAEEHRQTRAVMMNLVAGWADQENVYQALDTLLRTGYFKREPYANDLPLILNKMLKKHPEHLAHLLRDVRETFHELIKKDESFLPSFVKALATQVSLSQMVQHLADLKIDPRPSVKHIPRDGPAHPSLFRDDKWFLAALFGFDRNELDNYKVYKITDAPALSATKIRNNEGNYIRAIKNNLTNESPIPLPQSDCCYALNNLLSEIYKSDSIVVTITPDPSIKLPDSQDWLIKNLTLTPQLKLVYELNLQGS